MIRPSAPPVTLGGVRYGLLRALPLLPGTAMLGAAVTALAAQKGLTLGEAVVMNTFVYSATAQFLAAEAWIHPMTLNGVVTLAALTLVANMRYVLVGASLRPLFGGLPGWQVYPLLCITADSSWLITIRAHAEGRRDAGVFAAACVSIWLAWVVAAVPGYMFGAWIANPRAVGLDLVMPAFFVALLVPLWRGWRAAISWAIAGLVALAASMYLPGWWFLILGAVAGSAAAGFVDDE